MSSLLRSARPAVRRSVAAVTLSRSGVAAVPARRVATDSKEQKNRIQQQQQSQVQPPKESQSQSQPQSASSTQHSSANKSSQQHSSQPKSHETSQHSSQQETSQHSSQQKTSQHSSQQKTPQHSSQPKSQEASQQSSHSKSQETNTWATPASAPLKAAAGGVVADVIGAAAEVKDSVKAKLANSDSVGEIREKVHEMGAKARAVAASVSETLGDMIDPAGAKGAKAEAHASTGKHEYHTSSHHSRASDTAAKDLKDDANRLAQKVQNRSAQAGIEVKEQGQSMMHGAKKTMRHVGAAVADAVDSVVGGATTASEPVRQSKDNPELSTSNRPGNVLGGKGQSSLGEEKEGVKKSLFDGPQTMPQGVGERAVDAEGKPMETGGPRT